MRVNRRIQYPDGGFLSDTFPTHYFEPGDQVRVGFEKGTLDKARFELANGHVIEYERREGG